MKLYGSTMSPSRRRGRAGAADPGEPIEGIDTATEAGQAVLREVSPIRKVPVAVVDGRTLFDSRVIVEWLTTTRGHGGLTPPRDRRDERNIVNAVDEALGSLIQLFYLRRDGIAIDGNAFAERQLGRVEAILAWLPGQLTGGFGLAEVSVICALDWMDFRQTYPTERAAGLGATRDAWRDRPSVAETRPHM